MVPGRERVVLGAEDRQGNERGAVEAAITSAGFKPQSFRLDLRGLEVEEGEG